MTVNHLVTAGCSFSETVNWYNHHNPDNRTWPIHLAEKLDVTHYSESMGGQGNGLICRRAMYRISQLLKTVPAEQILVGVMWTGRDRFDFYFERPIEFTTNHDGWMENPTRVADDAPGGWVILNPHWTHEHNAPWYRHYYNEVASQIYSLEYILNLQTYLKLHGIKYFMTSSFALQWDESLRQNPNCKWLWDQIDMSHWLPVQSERHWVMANCPNPDRDNYHPHSWQHEKFVDAVIMPWLETHKYLTTT